MHQASPESSCWASTASISPRRLGAGCARRGGGSANNDVAHWAAAFLDALNQVPEQGSRPPVCSLTRLGTNPRRRKDAQLGWDSRPAITSP